MAVGVVVAGVRARLAVLVLVLVAVLVGVCVAVLVAVLVGVCVAVLVVVGVLVLVVPVLGMPAQETASRGLRASPSPALQRTAQRVLLLEDRTRAATADSLSLVLLLQALC